MYEWFANFVKLPLGEFQNGTIVVTVDRNNGILCVGSQLDASCDERDFVAGIITQEPAVKTDVIIDERPRDVVIGHLNIDARPEHLCQRMQIVVLLSVIVDSAARF